MCPVNVEKHYWIFVVEKKLKTGESIKEKTYSYMLNKNINTKQFNVL
jgi:hypothetical protein